MPLDTVPIGYAFTRRSIAKLIGLPSRFSSMGLPALQEIKRHRKLTFSTQYRPLARHQQTFIGNRIAPKTFPHHANISLPVDTNLEQEALWI